MTSTDRSSTITLPRSNADALEQWLVSTLASLLGIDPRGVDPREPFSHYGLDSAGALKLLAELGKHLDRALPATLLWARPTIAAVVAHLTGGTAAAGPPDPPRLAGELADEPIAIVGIGCRLPRAADPEAFWRLLRDGVDAISEVPADRWDVDAYFDADVRAPGKMATRWGGFLERIDGFDAAFFGISPREAVEMDPQQRLVLEVAWEALEDAGQPPFDLKGSRTSVFLGALWNDYATLRQRGGARTITTHTATGTHYSIIANRVSYVLGLQGPSMTIDTACSSSLVAIHLACQSLRAGESTMALAGGVTLIAAPESTITMSKLGVMAPDGRSRAFDAGANGYVRGEGAGIVVLKRLSSAVASGDRIYAVIRGSAVNNDGPSNGLTAPSPEAQAQMLRDAYQRAGIAPNRVQYIEAHGTGTPLGDPIEAIAVGTVLGADRAPDRPCLIGSVKTNIGHLEAAAGVAGLIKVLLAMKHGELPPTLHFQRPSPHIPFDDLRLRVQSKRAAWPADGGSRIAGVSAYGFGGVNCHVVLEDRPAEHAQVIALGARSPEGLTALVHRVDVLLGGKATSLEAIARSAAAHASRGEHRVAVIASSIEDARRAVAQHLAGQPHPSVIRGAGTAAPKIVFVCSGHGSQWWGMGRETLQREPAFRAKLEECDAAIRSLAGWSVLEELTGARQRSRQGEVDVVQPLLFAIQVAQAELWRSWGIEPAAVVGHSIGEVSAAHIAGILDLPAAARVICARSRLIREHAAGRGRLLAVELSAEQLREVAGPVLDRLAIAAINGPTTTVVGGEPEAVRELMERVAARDVFSQLLDIDYASHTRHLDFLRAPLVAELAGLRTHRAELPMMSTVTASILDGAHAGAEYWAANEQEPVQFWRAMTELVRSGHDTFIELGGHPLLAHPMKDALAHAGTSGRVLSSFRKEEEGRALLEGVAALHACGAQLRWPAVYPPPAARLFAAEAAAPSEPAPSRAQIFTLSARDKPALRAHAEATLARIEQSTEAVADLCYTSNVLRSHHDARLALRCRSVEELRARLSLFLEAPETHPAPVLRRPPVAFVFQGQGGQWWRMGRELVQDEPVFRRSIAASDEALRAHTDWSLCEELARDEASSRIHEIDIAQPATFAIQVALAALWRSWGIVPDAIVGHSMGEVAAAHVAGALSLEDAVRVIYHRSRLMKRLSGKGAMAVVELSREEAQLAIAADPTRVSVAGSNSIHACVLSGDPAALAKVLESLDRRGVFHRLLRVDVASHSPQMEPLRDELLGLLDGLAPRATEIAMFSSVTGHPCAGETLDAAYWGRNLRDPFLFADTIVRMAESGYALFVEIGPHPILSGSIGDMQQVAGRELVALPSLKRDEPERGIMLGSLGSLYERGFSPAWRKLHRHGGRFVSLPTYPWQEERFWPTHEEAPPEAMYEARRSGSSLLPRRLSFAPPAARADAARSEFWELDYSVASHPYLADHVVQGVVAVPGTALLELTLGAARQLLGDGIAVVEAAFEKTLFLPAGATRTVQVAIAPSADGGHAFRLSGRPAGEESNLAWTRHVTGRIEVVKASEGQQGKSADLAAIQARLARLAPSSHYASLEQLGLHYGPAFRGIEEIWRADGEVLGLVSRPAALDAEPGTYASHPALLDATLLQAIYAAVPPARFAAAAGDTFVPVGIGRFRMYAPLGDRMWAHARLRPASEADPDVFEADLRVFDGAGAPLIEAEGIRFQRSAGSLLEGGDHDPARWQYDLQWHPQESAPAGLPAPPAVPVPATGTWIVLIDRGGLGRELVASLEAGGGACLCVEAGDEDTWRRQLADAVRRGGDAVRGVLHLWGLDLPSARGPAVVAELEQTCMDLVRVVRELVARAWARPPKLWVVTRGAQQVSPTGQQIACNQAALWGLGRVIDAEHPEIWGGLVDLDADGADLRALSPESSRDDLIGTGAAGVLAGKPIDKTRPNIGRLLCRELTGAGEETQVALRAGERFVPRLVRAEVPAESPFCCRLDGTYLVTGGLGGVGLEVGRWLVERGARRLVLLGRTALPARTRWDGDHPQPVRDRIAAVRALELAGAAVTIVHADVGDPAQMRAVFEAIRSSGPPVRGIVHAAGVVAPGSIAELTPELLSESFRAKVAGTLVLDELLRGADLDFLVLFSSIDAAASVRGRAAHAAASSFLDTYAHDRRRAGIPAVAVRWGRWDRTRLAADAREEAALPGLGLVGMASRQALEHLGAIIEAGLPGRIVSAIDWRVFRAAFASTPARARYLETVELAPAKPPAPAAPSFAGQLAEAPAAERPPLLAMHLQAMIAAVLRCPVEKLDINRALNTVGLDSILATEVRNRIQFELGVRVQMLDLFRGITTVELAARVLAEMERATAAPAPTPPPPPRAAPLPPRAALPPPPPEPPPAPSQHRTDAPTDTVITPAQGRARFEPFPLTDIQYAYWVGRQGVLPWGNVGTHVYLEIDGSLDPERLDRAWQRMLARHDMLRAVFLTLGEQQILEQHVAYHIPVVDLRGLPAPAQEAALERERQRCSTSIPPLDAWPHFELLLHLLDGDRTRLHINLDAILVDAFSINLLFKDWGTFYEDPDRQLPPIGVSFRDYVLAEGTILEASSPAKRSQEYWANRKHVLPPPPQLPSHPEPNAEVLVKPRFGHYLGTLEPRRWQALKDRASEVGLTPASVMCSAFAEILAYWSKDPRFTIHLTQFRRLPLHGEIGKVIGDFTSTLLLGIDWSGDGTFLGRARELAEQLWTDMDHSHVSGVQVLRELAKSRRSPMIMPVVFTSALGDLGPGMAWAGTMGYLVSETSQVYLDNRISESNGSLVYGWDVVEEIFPPGVLAAMFQSYEALIERLADGDPAVWGAQPRGTVVDQRWQQVAALNATAAPLTDDLLHRLGLRHVHERPGHPAVITRGKTLSYEELFRRAWQIGHRLHRLGARPNTLVAIVTQPGWERIVAALGVLEAGAAYLPIDPSLPGERIAYLLANGQVELVLTQGWLDEGLTWPATVQRIRIDDPSLAEEESGPPTPVQTPDDLAYVIFTSGSTGQPKGVMISHRGAVNTIRDVNERFAVTPDDRVLALSNLSFDLSVYDIFGLLAAGGTIVIPDPSVERDPSSWAKLVAAHQVTIWNTVPALLQMLVDYPGLGAGELAVSSLRLAMLSGDWIPVELPQRVRSLAGELEVVSLGGATEASIWSILYPIGELNPAWRSIPYGKPMVNQRMYVLNARLEPCPPWVIGHLYIGGVGLAEGYWRDGARTNASFIRHPRTGERLYRTGDLGRSMEDGNIEFLGREDAQVKINGFRIELGEIEAALRQHPSVADCYVLARKWRIVADMTAERPISDGKVHNRFLLAYVVRSPGAPFSEADLRSYLKQKIPDYMVPTRILEIANVPLSANGKIDRRALPNPDEIRDAGALVAPRTDLERTLVGMWSTTLGLAADKIGVQDNFFDLGGNSLLLVKVSGMIAKQLAIQLRVTELFQSPTVESLASFLESVRGRAAEEPEPDDARDRAARRKELKARLVRQKSEPEL